MRTNCNNKHEELTLRTHDQTLALGRPSVHRLNDINKLLLIFYQKVDLVVVTRAQIAQDVFIAVEKHDAELVDKFVHGVEILDF